MTAVAAEGLTKAFAGRVAVEDLTFSAEAGEVVGLLGPNGAGKTTTIRLLSTVLTPTRGRFSVAGVDSSEPGAIRQRVGVLPESAGYPQHLSGEAYLHYHARLFGIEGEAAAKRVEQLLEDVELTKRAGSRIGTYSRGMRQRLGIARAMVNEPDVVLLDEPTLGLDPAGRRQVVGIVERIAGRGAAVVVSTHALGEVEEVCSKVLILAAGKVVVEGTVEDVTRAVAVQRSGRVRVPVELVEMAREALDGAGVSCEVVRADVLAVRGVDTNEALKAVLGAGVPVLAFEVDGARLDDAFLALTRGRL